MQQQQMQYPGMNQGGPLPPPGVVYVPVPIRPRTYDTYLSKQSVGLGIAQVIIGVLCVIFNLVILLTSDNDGGFGEVGHGFWCGVLFIITGSLGIAAGTRKQRCQIVGFMVMCIISAIFTISLLTIACIGATYVNNDCDNYGYYYNSRYYYPYYSPPCSKMYNYGVVVAMEALLATLAIIEAILAIWGSALCCRSGVCCCSRPAHATAVLPANYNYLPYNGQMIYVNQTQGGQGAPYMQQQSVNTYQLGLIGPPLYAPSYVQQGWTAPPQLPPPVLPPAFANPAMDPGLPEYSPYIEGSSKMDDPPPPKY